jgi:hypothetical protein
LILNSWKENNWVQLDIHFLLFDWRELFVGMNIFTDAVQIDFLPAGLSWLLIGRDLDLVKYLDFRALHMK